MAGKQTGTLVYCFVITTKGSKLFRKSGADLSDFNVCLLLVY
jgi:hypothetical protein